MLVLLLGQIFVDLAVLGEDRLGLRMAHIGGVIADDRDVDAVSFLRGEHVLDRHRAAPLPAGCRRLFGRIDVRMKIDDHFRFPRNAVRMPPLWIAAAALTRCRK
jgi:hypothetical protein